MQHPPYTTIEQARIMPLSAALSQYDMPQRTDIMLQGIEGDICVFEEDAFFSSLDLDALFHTGKLVGAYFKGNLAVDTFLVQPETEYGPFVYVLGHVTAKNIYLGGGYIHFHGNVTVGQTLVAGTYNHGFSAIDGDIDAEAIISNDHGFDHRAANVKKGILLINNESRNDPPFDPAEVLHKRYWNKEELCVNTDHLLKAVKAGTSVLSAGAGTSPIVKRMEKAAASKAKRADLSKLKLTAVPPELFQLRDVKQVSLSGNPLTGLGEELTTLTQLHTLDLSYCNLSTLPAVVTKLTSLESLDLSNNALTDIPASFAALTNLKKLVIDRCQLATIPAVLKELPHLEVLDIEEQGEEVLSIIDGGFHQLKELHIWGDLHAPLPKLERLYLRRRALLQLPESLRASKKLKLLHIGASRQLEALPEWLPELQQLEDLSLFLHGRLNIAILEQLPKLKTLYIDHDNYSFPKTQIDQLLAVPGWTSLYIKELNDVTVLKQIVDRPNLKKLVMKAVFHETEIDIAEVRAQLALTIG
jgi:hypothetical protein